VDTGYDARLHDIEVADRDLLVRNIRLGSRIWSAAQAFFFMAFLFAFFYLRALNSNGIWRGWPHTHKPHPSLAFGIVILLCVVGAAAIALGGAYLRPSAWRAAAGGALLAVLAAIALQAAQFSSLGFGPTDGGYASVFVGWTGTFTVFLLGAGYWLTTAVTGGEHARSTDGRSIGAVTLEAAAFVLLVQAAVAFVAFLLLYVVA
jgi:heme/copper-type cytochrome/quinol oxidase subunit 3